MPQLARVPEAVAKHCRREENWQLPGKPHRAPCKQYFLAAAGCAAWAVPYTATRTKPVTAIANTVRAIFFLPVYSVILQLIACAGTSLNEKIKFVC